MEKKSTFPFEIFFCFFPCAGSAQLRILFQLPTTTLTGVNVNLWISHNLDRGVDLRPILWGNKSRFTRWTNLNQPTWVG